MGKVTFEDAVRWFQHLGFRVTVDRPRQDEVTLVLRADDHETTAVWPAGQLVEMAKISMAARFVNALKRACECPDGCNGCCCVGQEVRGERPG